MDHIARNWESVRQRVADACQAAGRSPEAVRVVVVTKTRSAAEVTAALAAGVTDVGENRVQEAGAKREQVAAPARWHLVGQLQRNKAGRAAGIFDVVQSVDNLRLAQTLSRRAADACRPLDVLLQVNTAGAAQQGGVADDELPGLVEGVAALEGLRVRGLMTIAVHSDDEALVRRCFRRLRELAAGLAEGGLPDSIEMSTLSMGMSADYPLAIAEGATMIRVGTAVFGPRPAAPSQQE